MKHNEKLKVKGSELLHEDIRQHCLHSEIKQGWRDEIFIKSPDPNFPNFVEQQMSRHLPPQSTYFEYMKRAHQLFIDRIDSEESYALMRKLGINTDVIKKCVDETFSGSNHAINDNHVLRDAAEDW